MTNEQLVSLIQSGADTNDNLLLLYNQNKGLIRRFCNRYGAGEDQQDLMQECYFSLVKASQMFDTSGETSFAHYLGLWLRQGILRYRENCGSIVRVPASQRHRILRYNRVVNSFRVVCSRDPSTDEISALLGISASQIEDLRKDMRMLDLRSLNDVVGDDSDDQLIDLIPDDTDIEEDVTDRIYNDELRSALNKAIDQLSSPEQDVINNRYLGEEKTTYKEVAHIVGKSTERVRQLEASAMRKLRKGKCRQILKPYIDLYDWGLRGTSFKTFSVSSTSATEKAAMRYIEKTDWLREYIQSRN